MRLACLSITYHNTPVSLRECFSLAPQQVAAAFQDQPIRTAPYEAISEMAILSTCNRLEVYSVVNPPESADGRSADLFQLLVDYLEVAFAFPTHDMAPYFQEYADDQAVEHLFKVAAGLDSIALGETQILGQVSRTLEHGLQTGSARHVLSSLFRSAIHAGKRVHSETEIGRHPMSISHIAVKLVKGQLGSLEGKRVLVVGAGKMGNHAIHALQTEGVRDIVLTNRTYEHAAGLAEGSGVRVAAIETLLDELILADVAFTSTAAPRPFILKGMAAEVMAARGGRPLWLIDLAVPRNVEPEVRAFPGIALVDMDDLQNYVSVTPDSQPEIWQAQSIVADEVGEYEKLLRIIPFIGELHKKVEQIRQREVERALRNLKQVDPEVSEQLELFSRSLVKKILHEPTMHLRTESNQDTLNDYVDTLAQLFDLSGATHAIPEAAEEG